MKQNFDKLDKLPDEMFREISDNSPSQLSDGSGISLLSEADLLKTAEHAETHIIPNAADIGESKPISQPLTTNAKQSEGINAGKLIGSKFVIDSIDFLFPALAVWLASQIGYTLNGKSISLTKDEKEYLNEPFQDYLNTIKFNTNNPLQNLMIALGIVYGKKVFEILPEIKRKPRDIKEKSAHMAEKIEKDIERKKETVEKREQSVKEFVSTLSQIKDRELRLTATVKSRKRGRQDAINFLKKYNLY